MAPVLPGLRASTDRASSMTCGRPTPTLGLGWGEDVRGLAYLSPVKEKEVLLDGKPDEGMAGAVYRR